MKPMFSCLLIISLIFSNAAYAVNQNDDYFGEVGHSRRVQQQINYTSDYERTARLPPRTPDRNYEPGSPKLTPDEIKKLGDQIRSGNSTKAMRDAYSKYLSQQRGGARTNFLAFLATTLVAIFGANYASDFLLNVEEGALRDSETSAQQINPESNSQSSSVELSSKTNPSDRRILDSKIKDGRIDRTDGVSSK
jgi:hypothetical protein